MSMRSQCYRATCQQMPSHLIIHGESLWGTHYCWDNQRLSRFGYNFFQQVASCYQKSPRSFQSKKGPNSDILEKSSHLHTLLNLAIWWKRLVIQSLKDSAIRKNIKGSWGLPGSAASQLGLKMRILNCHLWLSISILKWLPQLFLEPLGFELQTILQTWSLNFTRCYLFGRLIFQFEDLSLVFHICLLFRISIVKF